MTEDRGADYGPPEAAQHAPREKEQTERAGVYRLRVLDLVAQWRNMELIDHAQATAADSFKQDFIDAGMDLSCEKHEKVDGSKNKDMSGRYLMARQNLTNLAGKRS